MIVANRRSVKSKTIPPPVGGWDTRNALSDMPAENAVILDNWFPETEKVILRPDHTSHATGMSGAVETIIEYTPLSGTGEVFAANNGAIYDVTSAGAVGAAVVSSLTNNRWQQVQIGTAGGQFLLIVNGDDTPRTYNGSTWANATFTGPTIASLIWCNLHQRRLWFGEKDSLSGWYLAVNAITGAATEFSLAGVARAGGYIMAMGTWTRDGGDGPDDVAVFLTSEGEAILYSGIDPSDSANWSLIGVFRVGRPIGRRCMIKSGADLIMITEDGFVAASSVLSMDRAQTERVAISRQINDAVNDAVRDYGTLFGWQPLVYSKGQMLIFNVPTSSTTAHQYVFNSLTGAPCRFKDIDAASWGLVEDTAYIGDFSGVVHKFDTGARSDNGTPIAADGLPAFHHFGSPGEDKRFTLVEPIFQSDGDPTPALDLMTDYQVVAPVSIASPAVEDPGAWGVGKWGVAKWGTGSKIFRGWRGVRGIARAASLRVRVETDSSRPSWISTTYKYTPTTGTL